MLLLFALLLLPVVDGVMEQVRGPRGISSWRVGSYRNRNVIPMPPGFLEKKHRRDEQSDADDEDEDAGEPDLKNKFRKKSFINAQRKGKKSEISTVPLSAKLGAGPQSEYESAIETSASVESRSDVPSTWGMTWKDPHPNPALVRDTPGYGRSTLTGRGEGLTKNGKISEQEFDSGLMGRGLGGMTERAQNENLMEQKFEEQLEDEEDVENENVSRSRSP